MKRVISTACACIVLFTVTPGMAEFLVYNDSNDLIGVLVDNYFDYDSGSGYDDRYWIIYDAKTQNYFKYRITIMGSVAQIAESSLYYTTDTCSGTAYVLYDVFNPVYKMENAEVFYKGAVQRQYLLFKSRWDGSTCTDLSNNVAHFREAIQVPAGEIPLTTSYNLQWHLEYRRSSAAVVPLID